jgi:hypothetical protein
MERVANTIFVRDFLPTSEVVSLSKELVRGALEEYIRNPDRVQTLAILRDFIKIAIEESVLGDFLRMSSPVEFPREPSSKVQRWMTPGLGKLEKLIAKVPSSGNIIDPIERVLRFEETLEEALDCIEVQLEGPLNQIDYLMGRLEKRAEVHRSH